MYTFKARLFTLFLRSSSSSSSSYHFRNGQIKGFPNSGRKSELKSAVAQIVIALTNFRSKHPREPSLGLMAKSSDSQDSKRNCRRKSAVACFLFSFSLEKHHACDICFPAFLDSSHPSYCTLRIQAQRRTIPPPSHRKKKKKKEKENRQIFVPKMLQHIFTISPQGQLASTRTHSLTSCSLYMLAKRHKLSRLGHVHTAD